MMNRRKFLESVAVSTVVPAVIPTHSIGGMVHTPALDPDSQTPEYLDINWGFIEQMDVSEWQRVRHGDSWLFFMKRHNRNRFFISDRVLNWDRNSNLPGPRGALKLRAVEEYIYNNEPWTTGHKVSIKEDGDNEKFPYIFSCSCGYMERCTGYFAADESKGRHLYNIIAA